MAYETVERIDATELPMDEKTDLADSMMGAINEEAHLRHTAISGEFDPTPRTITTEWHGDSPAEALGRSYKTRDIIREHTDASVDCELTGVEYEFPNTTMYEIEIRINGGMQERV